MRSKQKQQKVLILTSTTPESHIYLVETCDELLTVYKVNDNRLLEYLCAMISRACAQTYTGRGLYTDHTQFSSVQNGFPVEGYSGGCSAAVGCSAIPDIPVR